MLEQYLEEVGLSDKEASVYLALLQVENSAITDLAKKTKINRTTVYPVLQSLEKKGLASEVQVGKTIHYQAAPPERLETYLERQKVILEEHASRLKDIIPQIKSIQREEGERPIVKMFEGRDGAISAYKEFYEWYTNDAKVGYFLFNRDLLHEVFTQKEMDKFRAVRFGKNVKPTSLYNDSTGNNMFTGPGDRIQMDENEYPITCDISIIEDRIIITTLKGHIITLLIRSKDVAETLVSLIKRAHDTQK